ncbi:TRAP transporter small permease subunit [Thermodesulfobacteriota bacterium]
MDRILSEKMSILTSVLSWISCTCVFVMMLLTTVDVVLRYVFNNPLIGAFEVSEFLMVTIVFLSLAYSQHRNAHVAVDILVSRLSPRNQAFVDLFNHTATIVILLLITWRSSLTAMELYGTMETTGTVPIPVFPFVFIVAFGCLAMGIELLRDCIKIIGTFKP